MTELDLMTTLSDRGALATPEDNQEAGWRRFCGGVGQANKGLIEMVKGAEQAGMLHIAKAAHSMIDTLSKVMMIATAVRKGFKGELHHG